MVAGLWAIKAVTHQTRIRRDPIPTGYRTIAGLPPSSRLEPLPGPGLAVTLAGLEPG